MHLNKLIAGWYGCAGIFATRGVVPRIFRGSWGTLTGRASGEGFSNAESVWGWAAVGAGHAADLRAGEAAGGAGAGASDAAGASGDATGASGDAAGASGDAAAARADLADGVRTVAGADPHG